MCELLAAQRGVFSISSVGTPLSKDAAIYWLWHNPSMNIIPLPTAIKQNPCFYEQGKTILEIQFVKYQVKVQVPENGFHVYENWVLIQNWRLFDQARWALTSSFQFWFEHFQIHFYTPRFVRVFSVGCKKTFSTTETLGFCLLGQGSVVQKPINANHRLKINQGVYFSTPKCCSTPIFGKILH